LSFIVRPSSFIARRWSTPGIDLSSAVRSSVRDLADVTWFGKARIENTSFSAALDLGGGLFYARQIAGQLEYSSRLELEISGNYNAVNVFSMIAV
jgi:hypothetical protein